jgi:hypothetical protein
MSITFITGKPGAGKGLVAVQEIVNELIYGKRPVITNLALRLHPWVTSDFKPRIGLRAYLARKFDGKTFDVDRRVFVVPDDDMESFFLMRRAPLHNGEPAKILKAQPQIAIKGTESRIVGFDTEVGRESGGHLYVADEAWHFWGSRSWQKTGEGLLFYNAQHRKFGDDVLVVTQNTKQIDPAVHRVAQDFWVVKNHGKLSYGPFRRPGGFTVSVYENPPTGSQQTAMTTRFFTLDVEGIAQCYDTSAGVGLAGRGVADVNSRKRGLPFWLLPCLLLGLGLALWYGLRGVAWGVGHELGGATAQIRKASVSHAQALGLVPPPSPVSNVVPVPAVPPVPVASPAAGFVSQAIGVAIHPVPVVTNEPLFCKGYFLIGKGATVYLSDGTSVDTDSGRVSLIEKTFVVVDGVKLPVRRAAGYIAKDVKPEVHESTPMESLPVQPEEERQPFGGIVVSPPVGGSH